MRCGSLNQVEKTIFAIIIIIIPIIIMLAYSVSESDHEQSFITLCVVWQKMIYVNWFFTLKKKQHIIKLYITFSHKTVTVSFVRLKKKACGNAAD